MANTYTQLHVHAVFAVKHRLSLISSQWADHLYKYITGIVQTNGHKLIAINGMPDHVHVLLGLRPSQSISDLMQDIKGGSSKWINQNGFVKGRFEWQQGYGAFSYAKSDLPTVIEYIRNQPVHHKKFTFIEEYKDLLNEFGVEFDEKYLFSAPQ